MDSENEVVSPEVTDKFPSQVEADEIAEAGETVVETPDNEGEEVATATPAEEVNGPDGLAGAVEDAA